MLFRREPDVFLAKPFVRGLVADGARLRALDELRPVRRGVAVAAGARRHRGAAADALEGVRVVVLGVASLHLLFSSNTVTSTIIIPILIALAETLNMNVWSLAGPAAFTSSLAFILVTESPTNVIPYSSGYFSIRDMARAGIIMTFCAAVCVTISMFVANALTGLFG